MTDINGQTDIPFAARAQVGAAAPSPARLAAFDMNDYGNGMRLILMAGGEIDDGGRVDTTNARLLFAYGLGWIGFNGRFWDLECGEDEARKMAHRTAGAIRGAAGEFMSAKGVSPKDFYKFADDCGSAGKTSAMLKQAQPYLTVRIDVFDRDELAINCRNGTVKMRFDRSKPDGKRFSVRLLPHNPADRITRMATVEYAPDARVELFDQVLRASLPDKAERAFFQRLLGYASTGRTEEQVFAFCQGKGRDGKSTLLDAAREAMGTYAVAASPDTFLEGGMRTGADAAPDLIKLSGDTRMAVLSEPKRTSKLNEGLLKSWTGGAPISARDLHSKPINFRPKAKLIFECNAFPVARGDDEGIWRRLLTPQFRHQVPEDAVDRLIPKKLRGEDGFPGELPGVLNWLIEGVGDWLERGDLGVPDALKAVQDDYRRSSSPFGDWLRERCVIGDEAEGHKELSGDLYSSFKAWFDQQGFEKPMSARAFGDALRDRQIGLVGKNTAGLKMRGPIRLKSAEELASEGITEAARAPAGEGVEEPYGDPTDPDARWRAAEADADDGETPFG